MLLACQAAGPAGATTISVDVSDDGSSSTSPTTETSTDANSSMTSGDSQPRASSTAPSADGAELTGQFIPAGTNKYMLLCVNSGTRLIKLANVDVTDVADAVEMFRRLRVAYFRLRGRRGRNPFVSPKTMHYVKASARWLVTVLSFGRSLIRRSRFQFQLLYLQKSKECVGNYQINSIPSCKEILRREYEFRPCPPLLGTLPMPSALFVHSLLS